MDEVKALAILKRKSSIPIEGETFDEISEAYDIAIESLEKQIPKKPEEVLGITGKKTFECMECGELIEEGIYMFEYCPWCGKKLKWEW